MRRADREENKRSRQRAVIVFEPFVCFFDVRKENVLLENCLRAEKRRSGMPLLLL